MGAGAPPGPESGILTKGSLLSVAAPARAHRVRPARRAAEMSRSQPSGPGVAVSTPHPRGRFLTSLWKVSISIPIQHILGDSVKSLLCYSLAGDFGEIT